MDFDDGTCSMNSLRYLRVSGGFQLMRYHKAHLPLLSIPHSFELPFTQISLQQHMFPTIARSISKKIGVPPEEDYWRNNDTLYLHIGPAGDFWTGSTIFAAKHLQQDYVRSIALPTNIDIDRLTEVLDDLEKSDQQLIYDHRCIPESILNKCYTDS